MTDYTRYPNTHMTVDAGSCGGEDAQFVEWLEGRHPEIDVTHKPRQDGGGGHWDADGEEVDSRLWEKYCNSKY
jgi:hypothetical protein